MDAPTSYDSIAYPAMIFEHSRPDQMAVLARLHGLNSPDVRTAKVLHIGGGEDLDITALAAAYPDASFLNFDLAQRPISRANALVKRIGLANVRHEVIDISEASKRLTGSFDYIIANGIYAWVPDSVRAQVMPLIGKQLAPNGVAFVSFNTFPGGHSRLALREAILHEVRHLTCPRERLDAARAFLRDFSKPQENDPPITTVMRKDAEIAFLKPEGVFFHDIFNEFYTPHSLLSVTADARRNGLRYLGDARGNGHEKGFVAPADAAIDDHEIVNRLQQTDYRTGRYFHASLFVRAEATISRVIHHGIIRSLWASTQVEQTDAATFQINQKTMKVASPERAAVLQRLVEAKPRYIAVSELTDDPTILEAITKYAINEIVELSTAPPSFTLDLPQKVRASALARDQASQGSGAIISLNHRRVDLPDERLRQLLVLLDGTRDRTALIHAWTKMKGSPPLSLEAALQTLAKAALIQGDSV